MESLKLNYFNRTFMKVGGTGMNIQKADEKQLNYLLSKYPGVKKVLCRGENGYTLTVNKNNEIIAFASVFRREIPAPLDGKQEDFINVIDVVKPELRNQGIASKLIEEIKEIAKAAGSFQIRAYCDIKNVASHYLWYKNGFGISPGKNKDGSILGSFVTYRFS